jgi:crotonobetainyl-CoA:carnitine CoA-transferase CaiB-like acyl-CoA transferase
MDRLLQDLVVAEASRAVAVRFAGRLFAQMGATVVRAPGGDDRTIGYAGEMGEAYGRWLDAGKVEGAPGGSVDLVIGGLDAEGVAAGEAAAAELDATLLTIRWFHPDGPYAAWRGTDELVLALSGLAYSFGPAEGPPTLAQGHGPQVAAALVGFNAALAALNARPRPRRIETDAFEAFMCLTETGAISAFMEGGLAVRLGVNRLVPTYPGASYRTADGWLGVTALTPAQWKGFCRILGQPQLSDDPRFTTSVERLLLGDEVDALIAPTLRTRPTDEWVRLGVEARVPLTAMPTLAELPAVPHWRDRGAFAPYDASGRPGPTLPYRAAFSGKPAPPLPGGPPQAPLAGLGVVDFSMGWAGPLCARTLADLGADVVKIESEGYPDWWRGWEADQSGDPPPREIKFNFIAENRNKRGVYLDLSTPDGLAAAKALIARADVVVENFAHGVMEKLGLGPGVRRALNPSLVAVSMPAFGNGGPLSGIRAYGSTVEQASGLPHMNGRDAWPPCLQHVAYGDPMAGLSAATAVLAALHARHRLGGAEIDLAQVAVLFQFAADGLVAQQFSDQPLPRPGNSRPRAPLTCVVAADEPDTWLAVCIDGLAAWNGLRAVVDLPQDCRAEAAEAALAAWAANRPAPEGAERLQAGGVPAAPVQRVDVLAFDPQLAEAGFWVPSQRRYVGDHIIPAAPYALDGVRPAIRSVAPTLGEHTAEVMAEIAAASPHP